MVNGVNGFSNTDIWRQQAQQRAAQWAQANAQSQPQQADSDLYVQQPTTQTGYVQQTQPVQQTAAVQQEDDGSYKCTDGKDDGHIGFWNATGHALKGAGKFLAGLVGCEWGADGKYKGWSGGKALKNLAIGAAIGTVCVLTAGTAVPAVIAGAGVAMAAGGVAKSVYRAATAKTDAECKAAFNDFGSDTMALGLSLVGAKAAMKNTPGVDPTKYDGFMGGLRAAWDSTTLGFKQGWKGIKSGWNAYRNGGGFDGVKAVATESGQNFWGTVKTNWTNATKTPTVAETQESRVAKIDKQIESLKAKAEIAKKNAEKQQYNRKIKRLETQKTEIQNSYTEINNVKSFEAAQTKINEVEANIAKLERNLENATTRAQKYEYTKQLNSAKEQLNIYKNVVDAKTTEARNIRALIDRYTKEKNGENVSPERFAELESKIKNLGNKQKELDFKLPDKAQHKTFTEAATKSSSDLVKKQEAYNNAKAELAEAEKAYKTYKAGDTSAERLEAFRALTEAKDAVRTKYFELADAKVVNNSNKAYSTATSGYNYQGTITAKAGAMTRTFNNQYGTMHTPFKGSKVPFTNYTIPGVDYKFGQYSLGKAWTIPATNSWVNTKDEITETEIILAQAYGITPTEAHQLMELQAQGQVQAPQTSQVAQAQQTSGSQTLTPADWQMFDYQMKAYGIA